jgi:histone H3/H4
MAERILPLAAVDRIIRKAGAYRVSETATEALAEALEEYGIKVSGSANDFAKHAKRRTVTGEDIKFALKNL